MKIGNIFPKGRLLSPFLKWAGGKRHLLQEITSRLPQDIHRYHYIEPFIGGGALLFYLQPAWAIINDLNRELINTYIVIRDHVEALIEDLKTHENNAEYFHQIRKMDRLRNFDSINPVERASRLIYLNKTCFNGLYRVNKSGHFNTSYGQYKNPMIVNPPLLREISLFFNRHHISMRSEDFSVVLTEATDNSFVYLDPPYHPLSPTSNFTCYVNNGWTERQQVRLQQACKRLHQTGAKFILSNSATPFILELYKDYQIDRVQAPRSIHPKSTRMVDELLIRNYNP